MIKKPETHEEWLEARRNGIGGSDAACVVGCNPWKSNVVLWREKNRLEQPADISDSDAVKFGKQAEAPVRELFLLMHPEYACEYHEFWMHCADYSPFIYATLDGELTEIETGRRGIYEGKTTTIQSAWQWDSWKNRVPQHYYIQLLHQLLACEWAEFAVLNAFIRYHRGEEERAKMQNYIIFRDDPQIIADMAMLKTAETAFWQMVEDGKEPPLILPEI